MRRQDNDMLFNKHSVHDVLMSQELTALKAIDALDQLTVLENSINDLTAQLHETYRINPIVLDDAGIETEQAETQMDVRHDQMGFISDRSRPVNVSASAITFLVPFSGDKALFDVRPSTYTMNPPCGQASEHELRLTYVAQHHDPTALRAQFDRDLKEIKTHADRLRVDIDPFNSQLSGKLHQRLEARISKLTGDQNTVQSLGFPVRKQN